MSKIFRLVCFLLAATFFASVFLITKPALADQNDFTITQTPNPFSMNNQDINITVSRKDGSDYFKENKYSFAAWKGALNRDDSCTSSNFYGASRFSTSLKWDTKQATATWSINPPCKFEGDQWHFRLWRGDGWDAMKNTDNIIKEYDFAIAESGGQLVTINPKGDGNVYIGEQPIVIISNANPNSDYTFWWKDEWKDIAAYYSRDKNQDNPLEVKVPFGNFDYNKPSRRLCMEYGNFRIPPGGNNSCNTSGKYADFNFKNQNRPAPTAPVKCTILPILPAVTLPLNSKADIKIENVASGTVVLAYVIDDKGNSWTPARNTTDNTNSVTLTILNNAPTGSYSVVAFTETDPGTNICSSLPKPAFTVSSNPAPPVPSIAPCTDPAKCASGGGKTVPGCGIPDVNGVPDPRGPGIPTAIGCIHTNPPELVKDFMTFVVGISGGLAFLMMLLGAFQMLTSSGNPETLHAGRERLTSAIIGLLIVIFAILLLQIIGVDILKIPGFG